MKRVLIVGGGMSGLIAAHVFKQCSDVEVSVIERGRPGGDFLAGGLKYIHRTEEMVNLLSDVGIVFTNYNVQGGILLKGKVRPYPAALKELEPDVARRVQHDHYRKTRKTEPDSFADKSMNDPETHGPRRSLRCDLAALVQRLADLAPIKPDIVTKIEPHKALCSSGAVYKYDYLVLTIPLWVLRSLVWFDLPEALALKLNIVQVDSIRDHYAKWDYVYTPYTPENLVHRISPREGGYSCEFNGEWIDETNDKITSELNFLFQQGWALSKVLKGLNGHLLPMSDKANWPYNIRPLGRFAQWDPRATTDVVLDTTLKLVQEWNLERRPSPVLETD